nr:hypothetical protein [uncultured bacterium]
MGSPATPDVAGGGPPAALTLPVLVEGAELVGEFKNSGYREAPQLVRLPDGQLVRLPPLLYLVAKALHEHRDLAGSDVERALDRVAAAVTEQAGAQLTGEQVVYLADRKLAPLGVTTYSDGTAPEPVKADPWLALRWRVAVMPESFTWFIGGLFSWLGTRRAVTRSRTCGGRTGALTPVRHQCGQTLQVRAARQTATAQDPRPA